jgi:hypothetical protein
MERIIVFAIVEFIVNAAAKIHLINPQLLGEEREPIMIRNADKAFHFLPQGMLINFPFHQVI